MNETMIKYLAGLLDADGSLSLTFKKYDKVEDTHFLGLALSLASSDAIDERRFVDSLPEETGMGGVARYGKHNQFKVWRVTKRSDLEMLLPRIIKHMVVKGQHWKWLFDTWREQRGAWISTAQRAEITANSKQSRVDNAGPVKPKNHPTWAWLAGYLDGDGWYRYSYQSSARQNYWQISVGAVAHSNDIAVLQFLQKAFGGVVFDHGQSANCKVWRRNLGARDASFALRFLPNLAKHARLKRHKIEQIIAHHHQQRLSVQTPEGEAIV